VLNDRALNELADWIGGAKKSCDFLVVGLHWGIERKDLPTPYQVALGRACVDAGADVVWGNHPHVLQGAELYKGKPILYSMGNLISPRPSQTALARIFFEPDRPPKFRLLPCSIAKGRVVPLDGSPCSKAVAGFRQLCDKLLKKYPSVDSQAIF
jgi:poly-gamma-glutamate synthesis protein (capsule biosynthesis protein)